MERITTDMLEQFKAASRLPVTPYATFTDLPTPSGNMRVAVLDMPGSLFANDGGVWSGNPGRFASATDATYLAYLAAISAGTMYPAPSILIGATAAAAIRYEWIGVYVEPNYIYPNLAALPAYNVAKANSILRMARPLGSGAIRMINMNGSTWEPMIGESVCKLDGDVSYTSSGTTYVQLASANFGNLIPDRSEWEIFATGFVASGAVGSSTWFDINGVEVLLGQGGAGNQTVREFRRAGIFRREGAALKYTDGWAISGTNGNPQSSVIDPASLMIGVGMKAGGSGYTLGVRSFVMRRVQ